MAIAPAEQPIMCVTGGRASEREMRQNEPYLRRLLESVLTESDDELAAASPARSAWLRWHASPAQLLPWCLLRPRR